MSLEATIIQLVSLFCWLFCWLSLFNVKKGLYFYSGSTDQFTIFSQSTRCVFVARIYRHYRRCSFDWLVGLFARDWICCLVLWMLYWSVFGPRYLWWLRRENGRRKWCRGLLQTVSHLFTTMCRRAMGNPCLDIPSRWIVYCTGVVVQYLKNNILESIKTRTEQEKILKCDKLQIVKHVTYADTGGCQWIF